MPAAFSRREFNDAVTFVSGCGFLGGLLSWAAAMALRGLLGREVDLERWVLNGAGVGGIAGLLILLASWLL